MIDEKKLVERLENIQKNDCKSLVERTWFDGILAIVESQPKVGEWIPVEERMPEDTNGDFYQSVIVTLSNGRVASGVYRNYDDEWWVEDESGKKKYMRSNEIIAWMPLPEPYQGEEK